MKKILLLLISAMSIPVFADMTLQEIKHLYEIESDELLTVKRINYYFNQYPYKEDFKTRNQSDYWKTPAEFYDDNGGDCEDYSLIKYFYLRELGIAEEKLRLFYVLFTEQKGFHMVLAYYPTQESIPLLLDNIGKTVVSADLRYDLKPISSFNLENHWINKTFEKSELLDKRALPKKYNELFLRMKNENFNYF